MATAIDTRMAAVALDKIDKYGIDATFVVDAGSYSDVTGDWTPSLSNVVRKVTPPKERRKWAENEADRKEETVVYVAASGLTFTPVCGQKVTIGGTDYAVTEVIPQYVKEIGRA